MCAHFCYKMVHWGIFVWCIVGFVRCVYSSSRVSLWCSEWINQIQRTRQILIEPEYCLILHPVANCCVSITGWNANWNNNPVITIKYIIQIWSSAGSQRLISATDWQIIRIQSDICPPRNLVWRKTTGMLLFVSSSICHIINIDVTICTSDYYSYFNCNLYQWRYHQMETFSALLAICAENSPVSGDFPAQRPVTRSFDVFLDLRLNKRLSKQWWGWWFETISGPLWRHCNDAWHNVGVN